MENCNAIASYLAHLCSQYGYQITIKDFIGFIPKEPALFSVCDPYLIHCSNYCKYVKSSINMFDTCQENTLRLEKKLDTANDPFIGQCCFGSYELIIPVKYNDTLLASIGVGGFDYCHQESLKKIKQVAINNNLDYHELVRYFDCSHNQVDLMITDINTIKTQLAVLADYFLLYYKLLAAQGTIIPFKHYSETANKLYFLTKAIDYTKKHFMEKISVQLVSSHCGCSPSYLSHTFSKYMGYSFNAFIISLRIQHAKELLACSEMNITEIGMLCGYSDPNYFSVAFKNHVGCSPSQYRLYDPHDTTPLPSMVKSPQH